MSPQRFRVLIVAAHPDDEVLGMGGTIARLTQGGATVRVLFLSSGVGARAGSGERDRSERRVAAERACQVLGVAGTVFEQLPDNAFDSVPMLGIVQLIEAQKRGFDPEVVYTHHGGDLNIDHRIACQAVLTAFRPQPGETCREILAFEVNSSTEWASPKVMPPFQPDTYVDIATYLGQLREAYECYASEQRPDPHARSVQALELAALRRGREVGLFAAEAFVTLRRVIA